MSLLLFYTFFLQTFVVTSTQKSECEHAATFTSGMGTVLFTAADEFKQCWSPDEIAMLTSRMILEDLLPIVSVISVDSNDYVEDVVGYFRLLIEVAKKSTRGRKKHITLLVVTDLLGGYLKFAVLPSARHAFYAGLIDYSSMEKLIQLYEELKWFLRTNGQGWSKPLEDRPDLQIEQIDFETESPKLKSCCSQLIFYEYEHRIRQENKTIVKSDIFFPMPFFDTSVRPSSIAVPFQRFALRNIESRRASYFLLKFFISAIKCLEEKQSSKDAKTKFQNMFYSWITTNAIPKMKDDKFYSAFGGIMRIEETLKAMGAVPHQESTCPPQGEEDVLAPGSGGHRSFTSTVVLVVMLIIIFIWFIIGTAFICLRMRRNSKKGGQPPSKKDMSTTGDSKWSGMSKSTKSDSSIGICKCGTRSTPYSSSLTSEYEIEEKIKKKRAKLPKDKNINLCYPPFLAPYIDNNKPAVIETNATMKQLPSIEEMTEITSHKNDNRSRTKDASAVSKSSDTGRRKLKNEYSPTELTIPCKHFTTSTTSKSKPSWESMKKKIKPGMTIEECWCDILEEEDEADSDKIKHGKPTRKPSVEFSLDNLCDKRRCKERDSQGSSRQPYGTLDESNVEDSQKGERNVTAPSQMTTAEESPGRTIMESTDETSGVTEKEGTSPHTYACHSSLTGAYAADKPRATKQYIFGYDFHSSSSSDLSDEETDVKTPTSK